MLDFAPDIRIALRGLRRTPTFTITAILILGFGIGTAVAMFTVFRAVLLDKLPVRDPDRVVQLSTYQVRGTEVGMQLKEIKPLQESSRAMTDIAAYAHWGASEAPLVDGDRTVTLGRVLASGHFFSVLGVRPLLGRLLQPDDDLAGAAPVMVLSYKAWTDQFGGNPAIVGRHIYEPYGQVTYTIVGVAPAGLDYPTGADYWIPPWPDATGGNGDLSIIAVARLAPGATASAAEAEVFRMVNSTAPELHLTGASSTPLTTVMLGNIRPALVVLTTAVGLLLLIVCVNVGNLLLLRAAGRARELAIRRALGASYMHVVRQLLAESAILALGGGLVGLLSAIALLRTLLVLAPTQLPRIDAIHIDGTAVLTALGLTGLAVLIFGVAPALLAARGDVASTLRLDARSGKDSRAKRRVRHLLVAAQTTLALVMLAGGALLARSLARLESIDLGYQNAHLSFLAVSWPSKQYDSTSKLVALGDDILHRWRAIPGVVAATPTVIPPLLGPSVFISRFEVVGQSAAEKGADPYVPMESGDAEYFKTFGLPIVRGRGFTDADRERSEQVIVVSEALARRFWPKENPIGKRVHYWAGLDTASNRTIVGVAKDARIRSLRDPVLEAYVPWRQADFWQFNFAIRTTGSLASVLPALKRELHTVEPQLKMWNAQAMDDYLAKPLAQPRMSALLMITFGGAALLLAAIGLYGLMASIVRDQTREIGIRMALGAEPERLRREVLQHALTVTGLGAVVGVAAALVASRLVATLLYEVSPTDPLSLIGACGVLLVVVLVAAYVPARWATQVDPASALRAD